MANSSVRGAFPLAPKPFQFTTLFSTTLSCPGSRHEFVAWWRRKFIIYLNTADNELILIQYNVCKMSCVDAAKRRALKDLGEQLDGVAVIPLRDDANMEDRIFHGKFPTVNVIVSKKRRMMTCPVKNL